jgi:hypothetical protein
VLAYDPDGPVAIITREWWLYWPLRYFNPAPDRLTIFHEVLATDDELDAARGRGPLWSIEFVKPETEEPVGSDVIHRRWPGGAVREHLIRDFSGRPIVRLSRPDPPARIGLSL